MIEALILIIMTLSGLSADEMKSGNPEDYPQWYDQAKTIYYDDLNDKDGGNGTDWLEAG